METDQAYFREVKLRSSYASNITVRQPIEAIKLMQKNGIDIPIILGTNVHEGTVFVFSAFPARMNKLVYQLLVVSFFRASALRVLKMYRPLANRVSDSHDLDYRLVRQSLLIINNIYIRIKGFSEHYWRLSISLSEPVRS